MVEVTLTRVGDALGVVLPQSVIATLHAAEGETLLLIEAAEGGYRLMTSDPAFAKKRLIAESIMERYPNTLSALAK